MEHYKRVKKEGNIDVAVLWSPGFGAGWSTWNERDMAFDKRVVEYLINNAVFIRDEDYVWETYAITELNTEKFENFLRLIGYKEPIMGGVEDELVLTWLPEGTKVRIEEYDGSESIIILNENTYTVL